MNISLCSLSTFQNTFCELRKGRWNKKIRFGNFFVNSKFFIFVGKCNYETFISRQLTAELLKLLKELNKYEGVVVVKWSACSPSTLTIRVGIPLKPTAYFDFGHATTNAGQHFYPTKLFRAKRGSRVVWPDGEVKSSQNVTQVNQIVAQPFLDIKWYFANSPKSHQSFLATWKAILLPRIFKNCPIWPHCLHFYCPRVHGPAARRSTGGGVGANNKVDACSSLCHKNSSRQ